MFERMETSESMYEGVVEHSYKNSTRADANRADTSRERIGEATLSTTYYEMSEIAGKRRKMYLDHLNDRSKLTCLIHDPGHSSDECKVLGRFGNKYA